MFHPLLRSGYPCKKAAFLLLILSGFLLIACDRINVVGSGNVVEETREILPVDVIEVCCGMELYLSQGEEISLRFEAEDNLIEEIIDKRSGMTLSVEFRDSISTSYRPTKPVKVYTTMTDIRGVSVSGCGLLEDEDIEAQNLALSLSGGSQAHLDQFTGDVLETAISGGSEVKPLEER